MGRAGAPKSLKCPSFNFSKLHSFNIYFENNYSVSFIKVSVAEKVLRKACCKEALPRCLYLWVNFPKLTL